jgi:hypothetical protein
LVIAEYQAPEHSPYRTIVSLRPLACIDRSAIASMAVPAIPEKTTDSDAISPQLRKQNDFHDFTSGDDVK